MWQVRSGLNGSGYHLALLVEVKDHVFPDQAVSDITSVIAQS